jgi:hypothetical protein
VVGEEGWDEEVPVLDYYFILLSVISNERREETRRTLQKNYR